MKTTMENINQYDIIELTEDLNPNLKKGMQGTILEKYNDEDFEIEVLDSDGVNISFGVYLTFTVRKNQIKKIG
jgi:hypothetical protein